jgi:small subunit ribosomal protein S1
MTRELCFRIQLLSEKKPKPAPAPKKAAKKADAPAADTSADKSTLGDIDALAELKEKMEGGKK